MNDKSQALEKAVQKILERAAEENRPVEEILDSLEKYEKKKIKEEQMQAREKRKQVRAENDLKKIERTKRTHQLIKMGAALSYALGQGRILSDDEIQRLFAFYSQARTSDGKTIRDFFSV